jgi:dGTPase
MDWSPLLSPARLCRSDSRGPDSSGSRADPRASTQERTRSPFQQDADLIVFSAAFRRLQDKTQVQPLSEGGRVRTRLTHSIEVASVGRSLGSAVAHGLKGRRGLDLEQCHAMASVVHAACLAHDIGNPPFGHGGEDALQSWFAAHPGVLRELAEAERADFLHFDGNAQGLRTLTQLENYRFAGGLRLTYATLGAFMKYAVQAAARDRESPHVAQRKPGFFASERAYVAELTRELGLAAGVRHPLAYLTEAADDICYAIVDLEDGYDAGLLDYRDAAEVLGSIAALGADGSLGRAEHLQKLRGVAIGRLIDAVAQVFLDVEAQLLRGEPVGELCAATPFGAQLQAAKALAARQIFTASSVVERLLGGQRVLCALLEELVSLVDELERVGFRRAELRGRAASVAHLLGEHFTPPDRYQALLSVMDFLSALTDRSALAMSRSLSGSLH